MNLKNLAEAIRKGSYFVYWHEKRPVGLRGPPTKWKTDHSIYSVWIRKGDKWDDEFKKENKSITLSSREVGYMFLITAIKTGGMLEVFDQSKRLIQYKPVNISYNKITNKTPSRVKKYMGI